MSHSLQLAGVDERSERLIGRAREVLEIEADAIRAMAPRLGPDFVRACDMLMACAGRVVVSGIGKSGHVARKIASTFASTGTPAFFVHPAEASHGDLGMIQRDDVFVALSNSGGTEELLRIVPLVKRQGAPLIAITGNDTSELARLADIHLDAHVDKEACSLNLAPTASTTAALALGDALAVVLLDARGFGTDDYARSHPGGTLGRRLLLRVSDIMRSGEALPIVPAGARLTDALLEITRKRMGMTAITNPDGSLAGIFTDGDLRRLFERATDLRNLTIDDVMTQRPRTIAADSLAVEALRLMEDHRITQLIALDDRGRLAGALHLHDVLSAKLV